MDFEIPDKLYYKIGEVAKFTGIKPHVLRYWETEFKTIRPNKSRTNQRLYRKQDVELILLLKDLLYNQGFTIAGARKKLRAKPAVVPKAVAPPSKAVAPPPKPRASSDQMALPLSDSVDMSLIVELRKDILRIRKMLDESV